MQSTVKQIRRIAAIGLMPLSVWAQDVTDAPPVRAAEDTSVINVQGLRNPDLKPYRTMLKGNAAFERFHALAPLASLKYVLLARDHGLSMEGLTLRIAGDEASVPVELDKQARFTLPELPQLADTDAELIVNRKHRSLTWRPDVRSPGVPDGFRRLGDLRAECEVRWAVDYDDLFIVQRKAFSMLGGPCGSKLVATHFLSPRKLKAVVLHAGDKEVDVSVAGNGWSFVPPLADKQYDDESLLELRYAESE